MEQSQQISPVETAKSLIHDLAQGSLKRHEDWCNEKTRAGTVSECNCPYLIRIKKAMNELRDAEKLVEKLNAQNKGVLMALNALTGLEEVQ